MGLRNKKVFKTAYLKPICFLTSVQTSWNINYKNIRWFQERVQCVCSSAARVKPGLPWIWNFPSISISISTDFAWISMDISISIDACPVYRCIHWLPTKHNIGFYCLPLLKIYKRKNKMFAFDKTKKRPMSLLNAHIRCTRTYMHVVIKKWKNETKSQSQWVT